MADEDEKGTPEEFDGEWARWSKELDLALEHEEPWRKRGKDIEERYNNDRSLGTKGSFKTTSRYPILYSTVQTIAPTLYSNTPKPEVGRKWKDKDPIGRAASQLTERGLTNIFEGEVVDPLFERCVMDYLLPGRAQTWVRFEPVFDDKEQLVDGSIVIEALFWRDYLESPARCPQEVRWKARRSYLRKDKFQARFPGVPIDQLNFELREKDNEFEESSDTVKDAFKYIQVWEVWDSETKQVIWWTKCYKKLLDKKANPLNLANFYPCPPALISSIKKGTNLPIPDFDQYEELADELEDISERIGLLIKALRVAGVYDQRNASLPDLLNGTENVLIPVENWSFIAEKGGLDGVISWLPIEQVAKVLQQLYQARQFTLQEIYEITGTSDIIRGASDPGETATAQGIKANYANKRHRRRAKEVQEFIRATMTIVAEIMIEQLPDGALAQMAGIDVIDDEAARQSFMQALQLLRDDKLRSFRIQIETDSTVAQDENEEKQRRVEFLQALGGFISQTVPLTQQMPAIAPVLARAVLFGVRGFKAGRDMESALEEAIEQAQQAAEQAKQSGPPPDPAMMKVQAEGQLAQQKMQMEGQQAQARMAAEAQQFQVDIQLKQADAQLKQQEFALKQQDIMTKAAMEERKMELQRQQYLLEAQLRLMELETRRDLDTRAAEDSLNLKLAEMSITERMKAMESAGEGDESASKAKSGGSAPVFNVVLPKDGPKEGVIETLPDGSRRFRVQHVEEGPIE